MGGPDRYQRFKTLAENFCANLGKSDGEISARDGFEGVGEVGKVCIDVVMAAGAMEMLGKTEQLQGEVEKWLRFADQMCTGCDVDVRLQELNAHMEMRSVLVGNGFDVTVADLAVFGAVHENLGAGEAGELKKVKHVLRWIDYIQSKEGVAGVYRYIPVEKAKFNPPKSIPRTAKPVAAKEAVAQEAASVIKEAGDGAVVKDAKPKEKKEKKEKPPAVKKESDTSFSVLDVRVGVIKQVWKHPGADALYVEEIDIGEPNVRQIVSGLAKFLTEEQMLNRRVLVLTNVKAGKVRDVLSAGLVLCASNSDHTQCEPVVPPAEAKIGEKVTVAGFEGTPEDVLNPKKKQFEKIQPDLATDANGVACYQGIPFLLSGKTCTSSILNGIVK